MSDPPPTRHSDPTGRGADDTDDVLEVCRRRIASFGSLSSADREDAAQQAVTRVLEAQARGEVTNTAAYARRVAYHCGVDAWRRARAPRHAVAATNDPRTDVEATAGRASQRTFSPELLLGEKRRMERMDAIGAELRALLESAPDNYRHVLVRRYLEDRSLEEVVLEEIERRIARGVLTPDEARDPVERKRIQDGVHAWHSRAIRWLQQRACSSWREVLRRPASDGEES